MLVEQNKQGKQSTDWNKYFGSFIYPYGVFRGYKKFVSEIKKNWPKNGGRILELGSGSGRISFWFSEILPVSEIVLVDFNKKLLAKNKKIFGGKNIKVKFLQEDIRKLDLNEKFDLIHSSGVLEHFSPTDQERIVTIHKKHLNENGWVISYVPTPEPFYRFWRSLEEFVKIWRFHDETPFRKPEFKKLFDDHGFKVLDSNKVWNYYLTELGILAKLK